MTFLVVLCYLLLAPTFLKGRELSDKKKCVTWGAGVAAALMQHSDWDALWMGATAVKLGRCGQHCFSALSGRSRQGMISSSTCVASGAERCSQLCCKCASILGPRVGEGTELG